ncbi:MULTISPECIES: hypothetical protein [Actinomycetaceae]|uniref:Uncharacterized protein n=1 Tax=Actinotignum sanguinis TaxID=1445614 RepID=A0ABT5V7K3_9ACTO|nr:MULTISPECIES: hypothetical protein [Actinotignum]MDE1552485.1 hypothetical protein [Actinotignum sanguinis]MDE1577007.1 hypothetical protein [Actinotignum sanguinis]MDE1653899.1 hypothetical protein [Actinotignum schaalii]MDE1656905.1 hypothetical protein [Actinotignum sanguinis]MDK6907271.1 hypothetical protein [Actinotignum timonense]
MHKNTNTSTTPTRPGVHLGWPRDVETNIETVYAVTRDRLPPFVQESHWYTNIEDARAAASEAGGIVWASQIVTTMSISEWALVHEATPKPDSFGEETPDPR